MSTDRRHTQSTCPDCGAAEMGVPATAPPWKWTGLTIDHRSDCPDPTAAAINYYEWDKRSEAGNKPKAPRPPGPDKRGSRSCLSGSVASGGNREYCTCDACF